MTLEQINGALEAVEAQERHRLQHALVIARAAQAADKDYRKIARMLQ